jgi:heavy metal sensor kinase
MNTRSLRFRVTMLYSGLLTLSLLLFGASAYLGLERYLDSRLKRALEEQARLIGEKLLVDVVARGDSYVIEEVTEGNSPEITGRFLRITRPNGAVLYQSGLPRNRSFDPSLIAVQPIAASQAGFRLQTVGHARMLIYTYYYLAAANHPYLVEAGAPYEEVSHVLRGLSLALAVGLPLIVCAAVVGGYAMMNRALRPVNELAQQAERISSRNLNERLPVLHSGAEIEKLGTSLNLMIERLDDSFQHIQRFSADVSHELRTPLTVLRGELETFAQQRVSADQLEMLGSALEETDRLTKIVEQLLAISRLDAGEACSELVPLDLGEIALSTAEQLHLLAKEKEIKLSFGITPGVILEADVIRLRQVIANLLDNAIKYTQVGGKVDVGVNCSGQSALLHVGDNGPGIAPDCLPHIFERFYRSDRARSRASGGSGLGLAIVKAICDAHGAEISVVSTEGAGSCFTIKWPLAMAHGPGGRTGVWGLHTSSPQLTLEQ